MTSPQKAIILYNYNENNYYKYSFSSLDKIVSLGCSGRVILEDLDQELSRVNDIKQILGMSDYDNPEEMKQCIKDRFGNMKLGIVSTSSKVISMGSDAGLTISYLIKTDTTIEQLQIYIQQQLKDDTFDCLFIDLTMENDDDSSLSWNWMDHMMKEWVETSTILKCIITKYSKNKSAMNNLPSFDQQQLNVNNKNNKNGKKSNIKKYYLDDIIPPQSYEYKDGIRIKIIRDVKYVCAYYHSDTTRADMVKKFNVNEMEKLGCNGSILSWHYLAEIGNKLGYVPKYGA